MNDAGVFRGLIISRPPNLAQVKRQNRWILVLLLIGIFLLCLVPAIPGVLLLWHAWQASQWDTFWDNFVIDVVAATVSTLSLSDSFTLRFWHSARAKEKGAEVLLPLRQAAAAGDERMAPPADEQPAPLTEIPLGVTSWGPFKLPPESRREWLMGWGSALAFLGLAAGLSAPFVGSYVDGTTALILGSIAASLLACGLLLLLLGWRILTSVIIVADDWSLVWRRRRWWGRPTQMAWHDARAFYTFRYDKKKASSLYWEPYQVYVLDGQDVTLAWMVATAPRPEEQLTQEELTSLIDGRFQRPITNQFLRARIKFANLLLPYVAKTKDHERFCQLIAARTRLPLRDLTAAAEELADPSEIAPAVRIKKTLSSNPQDRAWLQNRPKRIKLPFRYYPLAFAPLLLLALLAGTSWGLQLYQSYQYEALLAQIRTHKPLFHDALSAPDDNWLVQSPTPLDPGSYSYANGSYQLTGDYSMMAIAPGVYGDAEVEVTVRLSSPLSSDQYSDLGLILHSDSLEDNQLDAGLVFTLDPAGQWSIGRLNDEFQDTTGSYIHESGAIHQGLGASNRLAVIMRGNEYLCFINDQFVGRYLDSGPTTGLIGLYTDANTAVAAFTDFTVYPL